MIDVPFRFGCNDDGEFGYIINQGGADSVIPFKRDFTLVVKVTMNSTSGSGSIQSTYEKEVTIKNVRGNITILGGSGDGSRVSISSSTMQLHLVSVTVVSFQYD